jgi:hypothetical protein
VTPDPATLHRVWSRERYRWHWCREGTRRALCGHECDGADVEPEASADLLAKRVCLSCRRIRRSMIRSAS